MGRFAVCAVVALASLGSFMAANFEANPIAALVCNGFAELKLEPVGPIKPGFPQRFKITEGTMLHLRRLQLEGKVIEVDLNGRVYVR